MKTLQINLGLNNNPMNGLEVTNYFENLENYRLIGSYIKDMDFNGQIEPTFVALLEYNYTKQSKIVVDFENWCSFFTQESIAVSTEYMEFLAFNINYKGAPYRFDKDLFEYFKK